MQEHAAELDAILRESGAQVPVAATLDEAAADPALTLDVARELLRDAAAGIRQLAARATPRTEPAEGRESECPWGGCGDCVGHEVTQPAGGGAQEVVSWARPLYATESAEGWEPGELVDIEFHNRAEKPEGEGWRPLVFADTGDGAPQPTHSKEAAR